MKQAAPGKVLVIFRPIKPALVFDGEDLQPPWACELSTVPRFGDTVSFFDATAPRFPNRRPWVRTDLNTWGFTSNRTLWRVCHNPLHLIDLDVVVVTVEPVADYESEADAIDELHTAALALDLPEPRIRYKHTTVDKSKERKPAP